MQQDFGNLTVTELSKWMCMANRIATRGLIIGGPNKMVDKYYGIYNNCSKQETQLILVMQTAKEFNSATNNQTRGIISYWW